MSVPETIKPIKIKGARTIRILIVCLAAFAWAVLILALFFKHHEWLIVPEALLGIFKAVGFNLLLFFLAAGLGLRVFSFFIGKDSEEKLPLILACAMGIGIIESLVFFAAALRLLDMGWLLWLGLAFIALFSSRQLVKVVSRLRALLVWPEEVALREWILILALLICLCAALVQSLAPLQSWDALVYHLNLPRLYINHGGFYRVVGSLNSNMPLQVEMLFTLSMALAGDIAAQVNHYMIGMLVLAGIAGLIRESGGSREGGMLAGLLLVASPTVYFDMISSYNDLAIALFILAGFWCIERSGAESRSGRSGWICAGGLVAGFALASKYMAVIPLSALVVLILVRGGKWRDRIRPAILFSLFAAIPFIPWLVKNAVLLGNPVYPFLAGILGSGDWDAATLAEYMSFEHRIGMGRGWLDYILLPLRLFACGQRFTLQFDAVYHPLILVFGIMYLVMPQKNRRVMMAWLFVALAFCGWSASSQQGRYLMPAVCLMAVPAGFAGAYLLERAGRALGLALVSIILLVSLVMFPEEIFMVGTDMLAVSGKIKRERYLELNSFRPALKHIRAILWINQNIPQDSKVFVIGTNALYYMDREYFATSVFEVSDAKRLIAESNDASGFRRWLLKEGFTHILNAQKGPWDVPEMLVQERLDQFRKARRVYDEFKQRHARVIYHDEASEVLRILR